MNDSPLIKKVQEENDEEALKKLISLHSGIYIEMVSKYTSRTANTYDKDDLFSEKDLTIYQCAKKFDPSKNTKFSTYLANEARWKCLNANKKEAKMQTESIEDSFESHVYSKDFLLDIEEEEIIREVYLCAEKHPDKRVKKILDLRYKLGNNRCATWKTVSEQVGLSIQGCIDIHDKFIKQVKKDICII